MSNNIVCEAKPKISFLVLVLLFAFVVVLLCIIVTHVKLGLLLSVLLLLILIQIPIRYIIFDDRIEIKCILKTWRIFYGEITNVALSGSNVIFTGALIKPILSFNNLICIRRLKGLSFIISPEDSNKLIAELNNAIKGHKAK